MAQYYHPISDAVLNQAYEWAVENDYEPKDLLNEDVGEALITAINTTYQ
jgi:exosome complex component RRP4